MKSYAESGSFVECGCFFRKWWLSAGRTAECMLEREAYLSNHCERAESKVTQMDVHNHVVTFLFGCCCLSPLCRTNPDKKYSYSGQGHRSHYNLGRDSGELQPAVSILIAVCDCYVTFCYKPREVQNRSVLAWVPKLHYALKYSLLSAIFQVDNLLNQTPF